jgi:hypothetical protein
MMRVNLYDRIVGGTFKGTWVSSGATANPISSALIDKNQAVVSSVSAVSSGNGFYFAYHQLPNTPGYYVNEWRAGVGLTTYVNRQLVRVNDVKVD